MASEVFAYFVDALKRLAGALTSKLVFRSIGCAVKQGFLRHCRKLSLSKALDQIDRTFSRQGLMLQRIARIAGHLYGLESGRSLAHLERHFHTIHTARQGYIDQR